MVKKQRSMFKIALIAVGKHKDENLADLGKEYAKRISPYARLEEIELKEEPFGKKDSRTGIKRAEGKKLLQYLENNAKGAFVIALDTRGKQPDSEEFAQLLAERGEGGRQITFVVGGTLGLSEEVLGKADMKLSLSKMTFTHFMARIILLEQIYRGLTILEGKRYHY